MTELWYDPARIDRLRQATIRALEEIDSIPIGDPAATDARHAVANLRTTLETIWMPALDRIYHSRAMVEWRRAHGEHSPARIVNGLRRGHRDPIDLRLRLLDQIIIDLKACTDPIHQDVLLTRFDALVVWINHHGLSVSAERLESLLDIVEQLDWTEASGLMAANPIRRRHIAAIFGAYLTTIFGFGAVIGSESQAIGREDHWLTRSPSLVRLISAHPEYIDSTALASITRLMLTFNTRLGKWSTSVHQIDRWNEANALLSIVSQSPEIIELIIDDHTLIALSTDHNLDPAAVEEVLSVALTGDVQTGLVRLARVIEIAGDDNLTPAARRGVARGLGVLLGSIAPHLDRRIDVMVSTEGGVVTLGTYEDVARLIGQILDDETSQMIVGLAVSAARQERMGAVESYLADDFEGNPSDASLVVSGALGDVTRIMRLLEAGRDERNDLLALRHAIAMARTRAVVDMLRVTMSAGPVIGRAIAGTTSVIVKATLDGESRRVGGDHIDDTWAYDSLLLLLELPATSRSARRALGLDDISDATWEEVRDLVMLASTQPERLAEVFTRLRGLSVEFRDLDQYVNIVRSVSGEILLE